MKSRKFTNRAYLDQLEQKVMVFDGAMGTNLETQNLTAENFGGVEFQGCNDFLTLTCPEAVKKVSASFLEAGVDVIETNTFRSNRLTLDEYGLGDKVIEINQKAAQLAKSLTSEFSKTGKPRFAAGSIGPTGQLPSMNNPELSSLSYQEIKEIFREQAVALISGGVDLILIETSQDILEVKAAINGIHSAFKETGIYLPIQTQVTLDTNGRMLLGTDIAAVLAILQGFPIDIIGLNCSTGPEHMREPISYLGEYSTLPVSCIPNAGLPQNIDGEAVFPLKPEPYAAQMLEFVEKMNVRVVGGCCGTTPEHLRQLVNRLKDISVSKPSQVYIPQLASGIQAMPFQQIPRPFLIGERLNTQGSRKFKRLMLEEDISSAMEIAQHQIRHGAHALDICVALTEKDNESELFAKLIKNLAPISPLPFVIDTTEISSMRTALEHAPGKSLINSINLDGGREKADQIFSLAKDFNAAVLGLTIDDEGMAKTAERKLEIAQKIYDIAVNEHGMHPSDLVFDPLTFTLATGDPDYDLSAVETLEGIRLIKENFPQSFTSLGLSNVSFGLPPNARHVINSVMLYHAVKAGLDLAIVNPATIKPYTEIPGNEKLIAEDLIFNRKKNALKTILDHFKNKQSDKADSTNEIEQKLVEKSPQERLHLRIVLRIKDQLKEDIDEILSAKSQQSKNDKALSILNDNLLPAMKEVGNLFSRGELILPFVLESAEVMKEAVAYLENYLEKDESTTKGTIILATVYGDVHDIGKNLAKTILSNNGYKVIDLGKQVPVEKIINSAVENSADAIGLSALLVSTSKEMEKIVRELHRRKLSFPVLIGGAAINGKFSQRIQNTGENEVYSGGVYYCKDAFDGLRTMDEILSNKQDHQQAKFEPIGRSDKLKSKTPAHTSNAAALIVSPSKEIPKPPFWGSSPVIDVPIHKLEKFIDKKALYRLSWGAKNQKGDSWDYTQTKFEERFENMWKNLRSEKWLLPKGLYGYWPAQSDGDDLIIYDPQKMQTDEAKEILRFSSPRQPSGEMLCLSDYFLSKESGQFDLVALQIITVGKFATEKFDRLQNSDNFSEAYFSHGLAVQATEAAAEFLHQKILTELNLKPDQGKRYSWGYSAIPDLGEHRKIFQLLPAEESLNMQLTSAFQLMPEQSTAAIIVHHPKAKYFNIK